MVDTANAIWRDNVTEGNPASGAHKPVKAKIREWGTWVETEVAAIQNFSRTMVSTRDFTGANDSAILAAAIAYAEANGYAPVSVHDKGSAWNLTAQIDCGNVRMYAERPGIQLVFTGAVNYLARQTSSQSGGGLVGFSIDGDDQWALYGISIAGTDFLLDLNTIDGGSPRSTYRLVDVTSTAVRPRLGRNRYMNAGSTVVISTAAEEVYCEGAREVKDYLDKGIAIRMDTSPRGPIYVLDNKIGYPANADGSYSKQPFAVNVGTASSYPNGLYVKRNTLLLPNVAHSAGTVNRGSADAISTHGCSYGEIEHNYIFGSGELGIFVGLANTSRMSVKSNKVENCDVGGINFGVTSDPVVSYNVCAGNEVRNGAMDRLSEIVADLADYYFVDQNGLTFVNNTAHCTFVGTNQTDYGVIFENCTGTIEGGNEFTGHANGRHKFVGTNTWVRPPGIMVAGTQAAVTYGGSGASVTKSATGTYDITFGTGFAMIASNYIVEITVTDSAARIPAVPTAQKTTTGFRVEVRSDAGTLTDTNFNWRIVH